MTTQVQTTLEYAPRLVWHRRRRWRVIAAIVVAFVIGVITYRYGRAATQRVELIMAQRRVARDPIAPDSVVFEEDPHKAGSLLFRGAGEYVTNPARLPTSAIREVPDAIMKYPRRRLLFNSSGDAAPLFAGRLRDDAGKAIQLHLERLGFLRVRVVDGPLTYDNAHAWAERMRTEHAAELKPTR